MARAKYISDFERDVIRIGVSAGHNATKISAFIGRSRMAVHVQITKLKEDGTLENLPLGFVVDEIAAAIGAK